MFYHDKLKRDVALIEIAVELQSPVFLLHNTHAEELAFNFVLLPPATEQLQTQICVISSGRTLIPIFQELVSVCDLISSTSPDHAEVNRSIVRGQYTSTWHQIRLSYSDWRYAIIHSVDNPDSGICLYLGEK